MAVCKARDGNSCTADANCKGTWTTPCTTSDSKSLTLFSLSAGATAEQEAAAAARFDVQVAASTFMATNDADEAYCEAITDEDACKKLTNFNRCSWEDYESKCKMSVTGMAVNFVSVCPNSLDITLADAANQSEETRKQMNIAKSIKDSLASPALDLCAVATQMAVCKLRTNTTCTADANCRGTTTCVTSDSKSLTLFNLTANATRGQKYAAGARFDAEVAASSYMAKNAEDREYCEAITDEDDCKKPTNQNKCAWEDAKCSMSFTGESVNFVKACPNSLTITIADAANQGEETKKQLNIAKSIADTMAPPSNPDTVAYSSADRAAVFVSYAAAIVAVLATLFTTM
jgi:hypothetical protein